MADGQDRDRQNELIAAEAETVSDDYVVTLGGRVQYLRFPDTPEKFFIAIRHAGAQEAELDDANLEIEGVVMDEDERPDFSRSKLRLKRAPQAFVHKCLAQIVDYCLPIRPRGGGEQEVWRYETTGDGDNRHNRQIYESLEGPLKARIEGAMDRVAGRTSPARKDFEALLAEQPQLLSDT